MPKLWSFIVQNVEALNKHKYIHIVHYSRQLLNYYCCQLLLDLVNLPMFSCFCLQILQVVVEQHHMEYCSEYLRMDFLLQNVENRDDMLIIIFDADEIMEEVD